MIEDQSAREKIVRLLTRNGPMDYYSLQRQVHAQDFAVALRQLVESGAIVRKPPWDHATRTKSGARRS
jgi:hypothetical protein